MDITAKITGLEYKIKLPVELKQIDFNEFDINKIPASCLIKHKKRTFAVSKWVSPKRTRSYPYEKVYNTLTLAKKITIIPVVKDEGFEGDRDFIQWDTVSLMSLLDVYVIFTYYSAASKHGTKANKITKQKFDNPYIVSKIKEIGSYHSSALHWNLKEIKNNLSGIVTQAQNHYNLIAKKHNIQLHADKGLEEFKNQLIKDAESFLENSRSKAKEAQKRESVTTQPKEVLETQTKATITINNYLGGRYYFTVDEVSIKGNTIQLIELKHSNKSVLPSKSDIKDGLLKMILYSNVQDVSSEGVVFQSEPVLKLTSTRIEGSINSSSSEKVLKTFFAKNSLKPRHREFLNHLFTEAKANGFTVIYKNGAQ